MVSPARRVAFQILHDVEKGEFAADLLFQRTPHLSREDAGLATELVMGVLRYRPQLDFAIQFFGGRPAAKLDPEVANALRLGVYQLRYLDRVPRHAAVNESVDLVKLAKLTSASGLVNAILRKVDKRQLNWPSKSVELCLPEWLMLKWISNFGSDRIETIAHTLLQTPESYVRVPPGNVVIHNTLEPTEVPGAYLVRNEPNSSDLPCRVQDISSQAIVPLLRIEPGMTVLDTCAAPGNKTAQALESTTQVVACDASLPRLRALRTLGCPLVVADAATALPFDRRFDRILVDAPCSGTGTIRRNPEIKWRVRHSDFQVQQERQVRILRHALGLLKPGGRLVYSTCSLEPEENEQVIDIVRRWGITVLETIRRTPGYEPGDGFFAAVLTSQMSA
ncbi:MAG: hypothetical protein IT168_22205 [Bryobacterales bacterium]|nr:hypothetical protein [Bryobacterales bacterium]